MVALRQTGLCRLESGAEMVSAASLHGHAIHSLARLGMSTMGAAGAALSVLPSSPPEPDGAAVLIYQGWQPPHPDAALATLEAIDPDRARYWPDLAAMNGSAALAGLGQAVSTPVRLPDGARLGSLCLWEPAPELAQSSQHREALHEIATLVALELDRETRHRQLLKLTQRSLRADRMLRMVADAPTCASALTGLLTELCQHHGAMVGRIWELTSPDDTMHEICRYNADRLDARSYYLSLPSTPVHARNMITAEAIGSNEIRIVEYDKVEDPERFLYLAEARASGLVAQISCPIWVEKQRFGVSLAFATMPDSLDLVAEDVASLADTMRPSLLRKIGEERIRHVAHHDDLTQLSNRLVFQEKLTEAVADAATGTQGLALLCLDLDGFKAVNDMRGHEVGDKLLSAVAARVRDSVRGSDTVARVGGDEFAIVQLLEGQPASATSLAERLIYRIGQPFEIGPHRLTIGVSIGVAIYPPGGTIKPDALLRHADTALYRAKAAGRNTVRVFGPEMDQAHRDRALIEHDLTQAVAAQEFRLVYQPICNLQTLAVQGFEALLRWDHPTRGPIEPAHFVNLAEQSGLILPLGQWALETACAEAAQWDPPVRLSVNLSPLQFRQTDLPDSIAEILYRTGFPPDRLDLEVTEGMVLDDSGIVLQMMQALKAQGIGITLDDFGTAYASLSYLRRFPFDRIKLDKSFIQGMCHDDGTLAIVQAIAALSARLRLAVVAEGVESAEELDALRTLGGVAVQGFLTGPPMDAADARALLARSRGGRAQEVEVAPLVGLEYVAQE